MTSIIIVVVVMACAGWMAWSRWQYWRTPIRPQPSAERSPQTRAFEAFTHGNTCLAAGQFADATAAFEQARALDPKRPHVAERLAEVGGNTPPAPRRPSRPEGNHMEALLMSGLLSVLQRGGDSAATRSTLTPIRRCSRRFATPTSQQPTR